MAIRLDVEIEAEQIVQKPYYNGKKETEGQDYVYPLNAGIFNAKIGYDVTPEQECHDGRAHEVEGVCDHVEICLRQITVNDPADFIQEGGTETGKQQEQIIVQVLFVMGTVNDADDEEDISQSHGAQIGGNVDHAHDRQGVCGPCHVKLEHAENDHEDKEE